MKILLAAILLIAPINDLNKIAKTNEHKKAGKEAYLSSDFETAAYHYQYLVDSLESKDKNVLLNLANSLYKLQDSTQAKSLYNELIDESGSEIKSRAYQQLGQMDFNSKEYKPALDHYKNALRADPSNEDARYNYEMLKKILQEQEQQNQDQQNQDQENQDQQNQDQQNQDRQNQEQQDQQEQENQEQQENQENQENQQQDQEGKEQDQEQQQDPDSEEKQDQENPEEGEESEEEPQQREPSTADKFQEMNISEEKAMMILEAMKNNEIQYIQQNKRKAKKKRDSSKPDW